MFESLWEVYAIADTIIGVNNFGVGQAFTRDGRFVRIIPRAIVGGYQVKRKGFFPDGGSFGMRVDPRAPDGSGRATQMLTIARIDPNGRGVAIGEYPARQAVYRSGQWADGVIFGPRFTATIVGDAICIGYPDRFSFKCLNRDGSTRAAVQRGGWPRRLVTASNRDRYFAAFDSANPLPRGRRAQEDARRSTVFASELPAFGRFLASSDHMLWISPPAFEDATLSLTPIPSSNSPWSVYSTDGKWVADAKIPAGVRLMAVTSKDAIGLRKDLPGYEQITVHAILKR